jgi:hypothetical protein
MLILNAAPETLTVVSPTSPLSDIAKASQLWEEAIDLLITAGRLLQGAKEQSKRNFTKLLSSFQLEKAQVNKLIKAASVASEIPTVVAQRLGLHQILQLGQPSNQAALEVIAPDDTQISIAQKIKSHRPTKEPVNTEAVKFVGKKGNTPKLRIEIPDCQETESIYSEWKASGLTALQWLQTRNMQFSQPQAIGSTSYSVAVTEASTTVAIPTPLVISSASEEPSSKAVSEEFLNNNSLATLVSRATEATETTEATPASEASEAQKPFGCGSFRKMERKSNN